MAGDGAPEMDVERIMGKIRAEVAEQRGVGMAVGGRGSSAPHWQQIDQDLGDAELRWAVGSQVPQMGRFPRPVRVVMRALGWALLLPLQIITLQQRKFNQSSWRAARRMAAVGRNQESTLRVAVERLETLQQIVAELEGRLEVFETAQARQGSTPRHVIPHPSVAGVSRGAQEA